LPLGIIYIIYRCHTLSIGVTVYLFLPCIICGYYVLSAGATLYLQIQNFVYRCHTFSLGTHVVCGCHTLSLDAIYYL